MEYLAFHVVLIIRDVHPGEFFLVNELAKRQIQFLRHLEEFLILMFASRCNVRRLPLHVLRRLRAFHRRV